MKTIYRHFTAAIALIAAVSCAKQEDVNPQGDNTLAGTYEFILNVAQEDITKTTMDGLNILWCKEDQIGIGGISSDDKFAGALASGGAQSITDSENYIPSVSAAFKLVLPEGFNPKVAGYPYDDDISYTNGESTDNLDACAVEIPAEQVGVKDNIPQGAMAMVGNIDKETGECPMFNVGAVIRFEITGSDIKSLRFEGNNNEAISGMRYYYTHNENGKFAGNVIASKDADMGATTTVTLVPSGDVFESGVYYFVVGQNTLTKGFTMTLTRSDGVQASRKTTGEFTIERNHKYTNFGSDEGWFSNVSTGVAGNLGTEAGTTATLYGIAPATASETDILGFQTSTDGINWTDVEGTVERRFTTDPVVLNVFTGQVSGLSPETSYYYRAAYTSSLGVTTYGKAKEFRTYAYAYSAAIDLYNSSARWPFTNIACGTGADDLKVGTSGAAYSGGQELTLTTTAGDSFVVMANSGAWINKNTGCLTMGVINGNYIKLPVVTGKRPVGVTMLIGGVQVPEVPSNGYNELGRPSIRKINEGVFADNDVTGGDAWYSTPLYLYDSHSWYLTGTDTGEYGIYFNRNDMRNCYISYLEVVYVDTKPAVINQNLVWYPKTGANDDTIAPEWPLSPTYTISNKDAEFSTADYPDIKYSFSTSSEWRYTRAGLRIGGAVDDYMAFKGVADYKLTYIKIRGGSTANTYSVVDTGGNVISGGQQQDITTSYDDVVEFTLSDTEANTEYRLQIKTTNITNIREMWITYELVK